jgi:hypothetical protein
LGEGMAQNITIVKNLVKKTTPRMDVDTALRKAFMIVSIVASKNIRPTERDKKLYLAFVEGKAWDKLEKGLYDTNVPDAKWWRIFGVYLALVLSGYVSPTYDAPQNTPTFELPDILYRSFELVGCVVATRSRKCFELDP